MSGGVLSNLSTNDGGITWTATLTPTTSGNGSVQLNTSTVSDTASNSGPATAASAAFTYDSTATPTAGISTVSMSDSGDSSSDFITNTTAQTITGTYSGTLAAGESIEVSLNGGSSWLATTSGSTYSATGTLTNSGTLMVRATNGVNHGTALSQTYNYDITAPAAPTITISDTTLTTGETATVTLAFAEKITQPIVSDFTATGGTLSFFASADGGYTWISGLTPTSSSTGVGSVTLLSGQVSDLAGNTGPSANTSASFYYDTLTPYTPTLSLTDSSNASNADSSGDYVTSNNVLAVSGLSATTLQYSVNGGSSWTTREISGATASITLSDKDYSTVDILVRQYSNAEFKSTSATLTHDWTIDTTVPTAYVNSAPSFLGLAASIGISSMPACSVAHAAAVVLSNTPPMPTAPGAQHRPPHRPAGPCLM